MIGRKLKPEEIVQSGDLVYWRETHYILPREDTEPDMISNSKLAVFIGNKAGNENSLWFTRPDKNDLELLKYLDWKED
jgi:hypothetical protein